MRFIVYGIVGWCMEIIWTGLNSFFRKDYSLVSTTSIYMFFIYGLAVLFEPFIKIIHNFPIIMRGGFYCLIIFSVEFLIGSVMKTANICPWDYSESKYNVNGVIRLDYAPLWIAAGLFYEYIYTIISATA